MALRPSKCKFPDGKILGEIIKRLHECHILLCAFHSLIHPTLCMVGMSQAISFTKSRLSVFSQLHKQPSQNERKDNSLLPVPCNLSSGVCVLSLFLEGCKSSARNSLITVILSSTKESELQQHTVLSEVSLSEVKIMKDGQKYMPGCTAQQDFPSFQAR